MDEKQRQRLDAHVIQAYATLAKMSAEGEVEYGADYILGYTGADLPTFNFFVPLRLTGLTNESLADAAAFFKTRHAMYAVSLEEHRVPDGTEYLSMRRYQPLPPQPIVVSDTLPVSADARSDFTVKQLATVPDLTAFYSVLRAVYDYTPEEVMLLFPSTHLQAKHLQHYVGYADDGLPVCTGTLICAEGVASVWHLATLDNFRRRGLATSLFNDILFDARKNGCDLSIIYATPMGFSLFNELGFKLFGMRQWFLPQEIG